MKIYLMTNILYLVELSTKCDTMGNRIITAQISEKEFESINDLVNEGYYCSRSDAIRAFVRKSIEESRNNGMLQE